MAVEKQGTSGAPMVAQLSHAGTLMRVAPEHLRMATSLETRTYDIQTESNLLNQRYLSGSRYVDLGAPPTATEERTTTHMQIDEPPPLDEDEGRQTRGRNATPRPRPSRPPRPQKEPDGERPPRQQSPQHTSSSSGSSSDSSSESEPEPQRTPPIRQNTPYH